MLEFSLCIGGETNYFENYKTTWKQRPKNVDVKKRNILLEEKCYFFLLKN